jgi:hypothetical protein
MCLTNADLSKITIQMPLLLPNLVPFCLPMPHSDYCRGHFFSSKFFFSTHYTIFDTLRMSFVEIWDTKTIVLFSWMVEIPRNDIDYYL